MYTFTYIIWVNQILFTRCVHFVLFDWFHNHYSILIDIRMASIDARWLWKFVSFLPFESTSLHLQRFWLQQKAQSILTLAWLEITSIVNHKARLCVPVQNSFEWWIYHERPSFSLCKSLCSRRYRFLILQTLEVEVVGLRCLRF